jgi:hypothetical protein
MVRVKLLAHLAQIENALLIRLIVIVMIAADR